MLKIILFAEKKAILKGFYEYCNMNSEKGKTQLLESLENAEKLAKSGKLNRFLNKPFKYLFLQLISKLLYPIFQKGVKVTTRIPLIQTIEIILPAGADLYLLGFKSHDSEIRLAKFLIKNIKDEDTFLDIGAHFGYYAILCSSLTSSIIIAVEASEKTYGILQKNISFSNSNIETANFAASDKNGSVKFYDFPVKYNEYNTLNKPAPELQKLSPEMKTVQTYSLSSWLEEKSFKPNYIKIDVEGAEAKVIEGLTEFLKMNSPVLIIEYFPGKHADFYKFIWSKLVALNFQAFFIDNNGQAVLLKNPELHFKDYKHSSDNLVFKKTQ
ncbi:MAG: FkbM family methyltransferase [Chitinophagaceae bacterium]|nr:MAG: FkbM family methyltransferase [Chitinophagaceae bacterium]